jgi:hypothetical protein
MFGPPRPTPARPLGATSGGRAQASTRGVYSRPSSAAFTKPPTATAKPSRPSSASLRVPPQAAGVASSSAAPVVAEDSADLDVASAKVTSFLSDSRLFAEKISTKCANSGCAFLCTGLTPKHCCRMCAKSPGAHGPKCQKKLLACSTPKCNYAVTGLTPKHCCKMCAGSRDHGEDWWGPTHGAQCWCLAMECAPAADEEAAEGDGPTLADASGEEVAADIALEVPVEESSPENAAAAAAAAAVAAAAAEAAEMAAGDDAASRIGGGGASTATGEEEGEEEEEEASPEELQQLTEAVKGNEDAIKTNEAVIQALLAALN